MLHRFTRVEMLLGSEKLDILKNAEILLFGVGGVGSYVAESLVRSGIGHITIVDFDTVELTNLNRQIMATEAVIGEKKVQVMASRLKSINSDCEVRSLEEKYIGDNWELFFDRPYDYVVDAIDMVSAKLHIIEKCKELDIPIISSMGTANKMDITQLKVTDIQKTHTCPLAKVMRRELKNRGIKKLKVVYSEEMPLKPFPLETSAVNNKVINGTVMFVPATAGLMIGSEVVKDLLKEV